MLQTSGYELSIGEKLFQELHLKREPNPQARQLGPVYSRALNCWAVELQQNDRLKEAADQFKSLAGVESRKHRRKDQSQVQREFQGGRTNNSGLNYSALQDSFGKLRNWDS